MVAKEVEIITKAQLPTAKPVKWTLRRFSKFNMEEVKKKTKGTDVILHINMTQWNFLKSRESPQF